MAKIGLQIGDHVLITHPGWYGDGEIGRIEYFGMESSGAYVRIPDRKCYRHNLKFLTKVNQPDDCKLGCCQGQVKPWEIPDEHREILRNPILDL